MTREVFEQLYVRTGVHCDTQDKAKAFLKLAASFDYSWATSDSLLEQDEWERYKQDTCYFIDVEDGDVGYCDINWAKNHAFGFLKIIKFMNEAETESLSHHE